MSEIHIGDGQVIPAMPEPATPAPVVETESTGAPADPAAPAPAAAPVAPKPEEPKTLDQLALMARERVRAYRAEREAKAAKQSVAQRETQLREREQRIAEEERLARENPLQWMGRKGVNGDELAKHLTDNPKPTEAERIAALEARIAEKEREETTRQQQWELQQQQRQLHEAKVGQADAFVEFMDDHEKDFPEFANLPESYIRAEYTNLMDIARSKGRTFTKKEVAQYLNRLVKEAKDGRESKLASKRAPASEDAKRPTANGANGAAGTADSRTLSSDLATATSLPANLRDLSADERAEVYRQMYVKAAR